MFKGTGTPPEKAQYKYKLSIFKYLTVKADVLITVLRQNFREAGVFKTKKRNERMPHRCPMVGYFCFSYANASQCGS